MNLSNAIRLSLNAPLDYLFIIGQIITITIVRNKLGYYFQAIREDEEAAAAGEQIQRGLEKVDIDHELLVEARERFVDRVVDDLVREVVGPGCVGIHAGPAPHRLQPAKDFNVRRVVSFRHLSCARGCPRIPGFPGRCWQDSRLVEVSEQ